MVVAVSSFAVSPIVVGNGTVLAATAVAENAASADFCSILAMVAAVAAVSEIEVQYPKSH